MVGSKDLPPSTVGFGKVFWNNQFRAKPEWPAAGTSLAGKVAIVTGGNTGLGYEASRQLLNLNLSHLILAVRSVDKGQAAAKKLRSETKGSEKAKIEVWRLDMSDYDSIQTFARRVDSDLPRVDYALLNAGIMSMNYNKDALTGHEEIFQVNYLSTVLLTLLLLPILKRKHASLPHTEPPKITWASAALTLIAKFPNRAADPLFPSFDDPKQFNPQEQYNSSKVMAHMFLWKLVDYVRSEDVVMNLADPAWVRGTDLTRDVKGPLKLFMKAFELTGRMPEVGASCFVDAMVSKGKESHGCFLMSWKVHP
jgi:NAD(P)-dependent dehydrogenase (short-subunit alcohol dehydrogenase family)